MTNNSKLFYSVFLFLCFASSSSLNTNHKCPEKQSDALLLFKQSLSSINFSIDDTYLYYTPCKDYLGSGYYPIMMNWSINTDCCNWDGITCDHFTGDVIGIDLSCGMLQGTIHPNSTLFRLPRLQRLNLAFNNLCGSQIPREIHRFSNSLTHLNISRCDLEGQIPSEILFLPRLISLDLSFNWWGLNIEPSVFNSLLQNSTHLRELLFAYVNISSVLPTNISSLKTLHLRDTGLHGKLPDDIFNLPYLEKLVLSFNYELTGPLPKVNHNTSIRLKWLDLSNTILSGELMFDSIGHLKSLNYLDLSETDLSGKIPDSICNLKLLNYLDLSFNNLSGKIPDSICNLKFLNYLDLSSNNLSGKIPDSICNLKFLNYLDLSNCNLTGPLPNSLLNLKDLTTLYLFSNKLNGTLPSWLFTLPSLEQISLDLNMFSGGLPAELFNHSSLKELSLSNNQFDGEINQVPVQLINLTYLDLSYNNFTGQWDLDTLLSSLPSIVELHLSYSGISIVTNKATSYVNPDFSRLRLASCKLTMFPESLQAMKNLVYLDISGNYIQGRIPNWAGEIGGLTYLDLHSNQIEGSFPPSICNMSSLVYLDMSNNRFGGRIPQCFGKILSSPSVVNIGNNSFHGTIPNVIVDCESLEGFILNGNQLEGDVPSFLSKCRKLKVLDIGNNYLNGTFPNWLGNLSSLQILVLKSNRLHGPIETSCKAEYPFRSLQVLDLSHNRLVGHLPQKFFQSFSAMKGVVVKGREPEYLTLPGSYYYSLTIDVKNKQQLFSRINVHYTIVDLSNNKFDGNIPIVIGSFDSLIALNLSHNNLNGRIPHALGNLAAIESLDLSRNQLSGEIPRELADIASLEVLDLSQNRLVGRIPTGKQFDTFEETSFGGNLGLCGHPLPQLCEPASSPQLEDDGDEERSEFTWKEVMLGYGCGTVIGMVMGYLMLSNGKPKWFNAMADAVEHTILKRQNKRRYIYIGK